MTEERINSRIKQTLREMLIQRDYQITDEDEQKLVGETENEVLWAFFTPISSLNIDEIRNKLSILQENDVYHTIIVHEGKPTPKVNELVLSSFDIGMNIELFEACDLAYNPTRHVLVPPHEALTEEESKKFLEKVSPKDLPVILKAVDPICRFYDFPRGRVIKITRKTGLVVYRIVR